MTSPQASNPLPAVDCLALQIRYGTKAAVDGLTFSVAPGEVFAILGPNGAGKTSTVEALEGYRTASGGTVRVLGLDPKREHRDLVPRIGVMLQKGGIYPTMTPSQAVRLFARYYTDPEDPVSLLDLLDLQGVARTPWRRLSGGEQQRLSLALALVGKPDVAFLDEPTAGVDPEGRLVIRRVVAQLRDRGAAVLLTTHELTEAERIADRVMIMSSGKSIACGTLTELSALAGPGSAGILFDAPGGLDLSGIAAALQLPEGDLTETSSGSYRVDAEGTPGRVAALAAWFAEHDVVVRNLRTGGGGLEDVYMSLIGATSGSGAESASDPDEQTAC
jgi:ABC-2 type transport system ATP-binding protein